MTRVAASLLLLGLLGACSGGDVAEAPPRPVLVEAPQPVAGEAAEVFPGTVSAREEADLGFRVPGKIVSRRVEAGTRVRAGELLATLDPQDARLNTDAALAAEAAAEADAKLAEAEMERHRELLEKGFISKSVFDVRENTLNLARARLEQARAQAAVVRNQAAYTRLSADKSGVIAQVLAEVGQVVAAGQPVFRFAADGEREVLIQVPEGRVEALRSASSLHVRLWANHDKLYPARVREIAPQADRATRTHSARITIREPDAAVQLGMTAAVLLGERIEGSVFAVPMSAVLMRGEQAQVWRVKNGAAEPLAVRVLRYTEQAALVSGALSAQDAIVTAGVHLLAPGQAVTTLPRVRKGQSE